MRDAPKEPELRLVHHLPGRLRVRSEAFLHGAAAERAREQIARIASVRGVERDRTTGSLLIHYDPGVLAPDVIVERAARIAGLRVAAPVEAPCGSPATRVVGACRRINRATHELTGGRIELRTAVPVAFAAFSVVSFVAGRSRLPRWDNLAYWSFALFTVLHDRELEAPATAEPAPPGGPR